MAACRWKSPAGLVGLVWIRWMILVILGVVSRELRGQELFSLTFPTMGTTMTIQVEAEMEDEVKRMGVAAQEEVERLVEILSDYDVTSELSRLSQSETGRYHEVSEDLWLVLRGADRWYRNTGGKFDASLGALTRVWRRARRSHVFPEGREIGEALQRSGWNKVELEGEGRRVRIGEPGVVLDLGAIAKGYIVDRVYEKVAKVYPVCLVQSGGDMRCGEGPRGREGWRVAMGKLREEDGEREYCWLKHCAIASSGDLFQSMEWNGKRYSHVIDSTTGYGLEGARMATVIAENSMDADACATAMCVWGPRAGLPPFEGLEGYRWRLANRDEQGAVEVRQSADFPVLHKMEGR